jgi:HlyD family secretion protein
LRQKESGLRRVLWIVAIAAAGFGIWSLMKWRNQPPAVEFVKIERRRIVELLTTNGKIEPVDWSAARAEAAGPVERILIQKGQTVAQGAPLVELDAKETRAALESAEARVAQANSEIDTLSRGGRAGDIAVLDGQLSAARQESQAAKKDLAALEGLAAKNAATAYEVTQARDRVDRATIQILSLEQRRSSMVTVADKSSAEARLRDAQSAVTLAKEQLALATVTAPTAGVVYQFDLRKGSFLARGDLVALVGRLERVRALIYVDEPELGRVEEGKSVTITWDAKPGREWKGVVEKMPTQVAPLGNRQVGEVQCRVENPDSDLLPGANITASIRVAAIEDAVALPKIALRKENGESGVYLLRGDKIVWRAIKTGIASAADSQVASGLAVGDWVALPPQDRSLKADMVVTPVLR